MKFGYLLPLLLCGCVHEPITEPLGPSVPGVAVTKTGVIFPQAIHDRWIEEGVPTSYFTALPHDRFYISSVDWSAGNAIRLKRENP